LSDLRVLGHPESPIRAIRAKCVDCCGGYAAEVRKCTAIDCPLWPFRMGVNPFHGKAELPEATGGIGSAEAAPADAGEGQ